LTPSYARHRMDNLFFRWLSARITSSLAALIMGYESIICRCGPIQIDGQIRTGAV